MRLSVACLTILAGLMVNPATADCSSTVNSAINSGVTAVRLGFATVGAPPNLDDAINAGVTAFKAKLGC